VSPARTTATRGSGCHYYQHHKHSPLWWIGRISGSYTSDGRFRNGESVWRRRNERVIDFTGNFGDSFFPRCNNTAKYHCREQKQKSEDTSGYVISSERTLPLNIAKSLNLRSPLPGLSSREIRRSGIKAPSPRSRNRRFRSMQIRAGFHAESYR